MTFEDLAFTLKKPFLNLNRRARTLQNARLGSGLIVLICLTLMICLPYMTRRVYVAILDCAHVDVANGLFTALKTSVNENEYTSGSNFLTTSEIEILAEYTAEQVRSAPQFITSNLMNWCFGSYNSTEGYNDENGKFLQSGVRNVFVQCTKTDFHYVFDYRGELYTIGLNIILSYAYGDGDGSSTDSQTITSTANYVPDAAYMAELKRRRHTTKTITVLIFFSLALNLGTFIMSLLYYGNRGLKKDDHSMPMFTRQLLGILALISFITVTASVTLQTVLITTIRSKVESELGTFGLSLHLGAAWFSLAWIALFMSFVCLCSWGGPIWCGD
ncbi:hypothetical protein CANARDRAFT_189816, partial [[Candida] arabinofermentans NRRL YB-2248]